MVRSPLVPLGPCFRFCRFVSVVPKLLFFSQKLSVLRVQHNRPGSCDQVSEVYVLQNLKHRELDKLRKGDGIGG